MRDSRAVLNTAQQEELDRYLGERAEATERLAQGIKVNTSTGLADGDTPIEGASVTVISTELSSVATGEVLPGITIHAGAAATP